MLGRIAQLTIPPAWREVWICTDALGHLQAAGLDAAGRKQYLYHEHWRANRDRAKFDSMLAFGGALPRLRRGVARDLRFGRQAQADSAAPHGLSSERVLACAVRLLDVGFFRIGSEDYAEQNESYGLTTMLREHIRVDGSHLIFDFPAKSGQRRVQAIADADALAVVAALKRRRSGSQLLAFRESKRWVEIHAEDVNGYIKRRAGGPFTAKEFRTWNATVLAAVALADARAQGTSRAARDRQVAKAVKTVAAYLGNTPVVCRSSYIDPRVIDRFHAGTTILATIQKLPTLDLGDSRIRRRVEDAVLEILNDAPRVATRAA